MGDSQEQPDVDPRLFARLAADPLAAHLGITLEQVRPGYARASMTVAAGREVTGWDVDPAAREAAVARGVRIGRQLSGVVVLAVPLPAMGTGLDGLDVALDATVTDLGSVKTPVRAALAGLGGWYVGG